MAKEYKTLRDAEKDFEIDYVLDSGNRTMPVLSSPAAVFNYRNDNLSPIFRESQCKDLAKNITGALGDIVQNFIRSFKCNMSPGPFREIWGPRAKINLGALPIWTYSNHIFIVRYLRTKEFEKIFTSEFNINKL